MLHPFDPGARELRRQNPIVACHESYSDTPSTEIGSSMTVLDATGQLDADLKIRVSGRLP